MLTNTTLLLRRLLFLVTAFFTMTVYSQTITTVTDCNLNGWVKQPNPNTTVTFVPGIATPPQGNGSVEFVSPTGAFVRLRSTSYHNTLLSAITEFSFSTFIQSRDNATETPFIVLQVDINNDGILDDALVFEPRFQTQSFATGIVPVQLPSVLNTWQTWDMLHGGWWLGPPPRPSPLEGVPVFSLATYISQHPTAKIINSFAAGGTGGIRINVGGPAGVFGKIKANVDAFTIGVNGNTIIYDFEKSIADAGLDKNVVYGYGSNCTTLNGSGAGGVAPYSYSWTGNGLSSIGQSVQVCATTSTAYTLTVTDANGCSGTDEITVFVNDVRCGNKGDKVLVCHKGDDLCISSNAVAAHLNHGDHLGACNASSSTSITTADNDATELLSPDQARLSNFPNPFVNSTTIQYQLPYDCSVSIKVFDVAGRVVSTIVSGDKKAGLYRANFSSKNLSKGIYYYKITAASGAKTFTRTNKMIVLQ